MKKYFLLLLMISAMTSMAQTSFKVGLVSPLPVDIQVDARPQLRSFLGEMAIKASPKVDILLTGGYMVFSYQFSGSFTNIPIMPGLRYNTKKMYFGANCGPSFFSENIDDQAILWSPYVGFNAGNISLDLRYFNWRKTTNNANSLGIVISYNL
jgi:hypothetical protein